MALNNSSTIDRPDGSRLVVGDQGSAVPQDEKDGKQLSKAAPTSETDIAVDDGSGGFHDLIADGDFESAIKSVSGTGGCAIYIRTEDNEAFKVEMDLLDENDNVLRTIDDTDYNRLDSFVGAENNRVLFTCPVYSERVRMRVTDESGGAQNRIRGAINFNPGQIPQIQQENIEYRRIFDSSEQADTAIFGNNINPQWTTGTFRVAIAVDSAVTLSVTVDDGNSTKSIALNDGNALTAGAYHHFEHSTKNNYAYNYELGGNATVHDMQVDGVPTSTSSF